MHEARTAVSTRYYTATTREALFLLSRGHCYAPECRNRVMEKRGRKWVSLVHVAHIIGLNEHSPRHVEGKDERELNSFENLILLCPPHHGEVDGPRTWRNYSPEMLTQWKEDREGGLSGELGQLDWMDEETLHDLMADAIEDTSSRILDAIDGLSA
jgi:hypothetical protein